MMSRWLAQYARTPTDVELWADASLRESRIRREHRRSTYLVPGLIVAAILWLLGVFYAVGPTP